MTARRAARAALLPAPPGARHDDAEPFRRRLRVCPRCRTVPADEMFAETRGGLVCLACAGRSAAPAVN